MTRLLTRLMGRLPIGYMQLTHHPGRMLAALAGVSFANVLVLVQLGLAGSLNESVATSYRMFQQDLILISAFEADTFFDGATLPRQRLFQALAHPDVIGGAPVYLGRSTWISDEDETAAIMFVAVPPEAAGIMSDDLQGPVQDLALADTTLVDTRTRFIDMTGFEDASRAAPIPFEIQNRQLGAIGTTSVGGGFAGDGVFLVSDQTFFSLFPRRSSAAPDHIMLAVAPGANASRVAAELSEVFPQGTVRVRPITEAMEVEQDFQMTERPMGLVFAFGVGIGVIVGVVISYQVLATDVADHTREYATFMAMGYPMPFFLGVVLEEALILAALGFWPGLLFAQLFYSTLGGLTDLPLFMTFERALVVFIGTLLACALSGVFAMRKLAAADPADLF